MTTDLLWFRRPTFHLYDNLPVPMIDMCTDRAGSQLLALLILAVVLHQSDPVDLQLVHHESQADLLRLRVRVDDLHYLTRPQFVSYSPAPLAGSYPPWAGANVSATEFPSIEITTRDEMGVQKMSEWEQRCDTVVGFGNDRASVTFALLLLDAGCASSSTNNVLLLSEPSGARSVGTRSAEMRIWLPGSPGHVDSD
jgi:hypothetical protein